MMESDLTRNEEDASRISGGGIAPNPHTKKDELLLLHPPSFHPFSLPPL